MWDTLNSTSPSRFTRYASRTSRRRGVSNTISIRFLSLLFPLQMVFLVGNVSDTESAGVQIDWGAFWDTCTAYAEGRVENWKAMHFLCWIRMTSMDVAARRSPWRCSANQAIILATR